MLTSLVGICLVLGSLNAFSGQEPTVGTSGSVLEDAPAVQSSGGILLVDERSEPKVTIAWESTSGPRTHTEVFGYTAPVGGQTIAPNINAYASVGGTRIETGDGHPKGLVVRVGLTKIESARPFFDDPRPGTMIEIRMDNVRLREPVKVHEGTGLVHLKYAIGDLEACSIPGEARNQYLLEDPRDTLGGRVIDGENATPGALDGSESNGSFVVTIDEDDPTRLSAVARFPFRMLRHLLDPWDSDLPNTFFEPIHLHAEFELIPVGATPRSAPTVPDPKD